MQAPVVKKGRTVEDAVREALAELGIGEAEAEIEVLEEPSRGFLGFGGRDALVRVSRRLGKGEAGRDFLERVARAMGVGDARAELREEDGQVFISVSGRDPGVMIGRRGQTLDALQYLVNVAASRATGGTERIVVDVGGYRRRREDTLRGLAARLAMKVKSTGRLVALEPMPSQDRKTIHLALQGDPEVETHSEGEEPYRKVVISPRR